LENAGATRRGIYLGETSRSLHARPVKHLRDAETFTAKSHIIKHWVNVHPDLDSQPPIKFKIVSQHKDCLSRQVAEAIGILHSQDELLNSKSEYMKNCLTRVPVAEREGEKGKKRIKKLECQKIEAFRLEKLDKLEKKSSNMQEEFTTATGGSLKII
jgi:hypothetical protein